MKIENCAVCGNRSINFLCQAASFNFLIFIFERPKTKPLCLEHLVEQFSIAFINHPSRMIVYPPVIQNPEKSHLGYSYEFISLPKTGDKFFGYFTSTRYICQEGFKLISGKCNNCDRPAQVAFFKEDCIVWNGEIPSPIIDKERSEILCTTCAMKLIEPDLKKYAVHFTEGIYTPVGKEGIFFINDY